MLGEEDICLIDFARDPLGTQLWEYQFNDVLSMYTEGANEIWGVRDHTEIRLAFREGLSDPVPIILEKNTFETPEHTD